MKTKVYLMLSMLLLVGTAAAMTWVSDPFLVDSPLGKLSPVGVLRGFEDNGFVLLAESEGLIIGRRGEEELRYHFVGDETVLIEYRRPLEPDEDAEAVVADWAARIRELYYTDGYTGDGEYHWTTSYADLHLAFSTVDGRRCVELTIDWPEANE
ncbi:MAG: hypothetical protein GF399_07310 [Candidatus Coatesbacteria bacterium]|nr:hypothetical protein [Candidatus Coatesbacteria bacterium]